MSGAGLALAGLLLASPGGARDADYVVRVDARLERMAVRARFSDAATGIGARSRDAGEFLVNAQDCETGSGIGHRGRLLQLPVDGVRCLDYVVDLAAAARAEARNRGLARTNIIVAPADWFWRPRDGQWSTTVRFETTGDHAVSVPWPPAGNSAHAYRPAASPRSGTAPAAFGRFTTVERRIPGSVLRIAMLEGLIPYDAGAVAERIVAAARNVTLAYGRFPHPSPQVVAIPSGARAWGEPVYFGRVVRDGGESVELLINEGLPPDAFDDDWTATHEFSHLMLPFIDRDFRWVSEGFAQYYQNVLLARAGTYTERQAWQKLVEGFERGRASLPGVSPNDAAIGNHRGARMKIYWTGAALALLADIKLRNSNSADSLDSVLGELQACCLPSGRTWSAQDLFSRLDGLAGKPVFLPLYDEISVAGDFPDVSGLLLQLGVDIREGAVHLDDDAPLAALRAKLMSQPGNSVAGVQTVY